MGKAARGGSSGFGYTTDYSCLWPSCLSPGFSEPQGFIWKKRIVPFTSVATTEKGNMDGHVASPKS